jgi:hypothetical protein
MTGQRGEGAAPAIILFRVRERAGGMATLASDFHVLRARILAKLTAVFLSRRNGAAARYVGASFRFIRHLIPFLNLNRGSLLDWSEGCKSGSPM